MQKNKKYIIYKSKNRKNIKRTNKYKYNKKSKKYVQNGGTIENLNRKFGIHNTTIDFKLLDDEYKNITTIPIIEIPNDGNCTYNAIVNALKRLYGNQDFTSEQLRMILADNIDNQYCLMLLFMSYKSITDKNTRDFLENGRRPLSRPYNIEIHRFILEKQKCIIDFFEQNNSLDIYTLLFNNESRNTFYMDCISKEKCGDITNITSGIQLIKNIIKRNNIDTPITGTNIKPNSLLFLDINYERQLLLKFLNLVMIEINNNNKTMSIIKSENVINEETRFIIVTNNGIHTNGFGNQDAYTYQNIPPVIINPIKRLLSS